MAKLPMAMPKTSVERIKKNLKRYQQVLLASAKKDINESDTVILITDILADVFGYQKFEEITSEHAVKTTYCDLAVVVEGALEILLEVKAINNSLKENHIKQAVDYAANAGADWVVLTNGILWQIYRVNFSKPVSHELLEEFNLTELNSNKDEDLGKVFLLSREGVKKSVLDGYHTQKQAVNRFNIAALILTEPILKQIRKGLQLLSPGIKIDLVEIAAVLEKDVLKRESVEGDEAGKARKKAQKVWVTKTPQQDKGGQVTAPLEISPEENTPSENISQNADTGIGESIWSPS